MHEKQNQELLKEVLIKPINSKCNQLKIVSGFVSIPMLNEHLSLVKKAGKSTNLELIIGMTATEGISKSEHLQFVNASKNRLHGSNFKCRYVKTGLPPVHAKVFCWYKNQKPEIAFVGSSNYTKNGFILSQVEYMTPVKNKELQEVDAFIKQVRQNSKGCKASDIAEVSLQFMI